MRTKVLIVEASPAVRQTLTHILGSDPEIEIIGTAPDPIVAEHCISREIPDVITLDVEMAHMDGITFLRNLMCQHPIPVVMSLSLFHGGAEHLHQSLQAGAVDVILKPEIKMAEVHPDKRIQLCDVIKAASHAKLRPRPQSAANAVIASPAKKLTADAMLPPPSGHAVKRTTETVVCMGASTGGTEALREVLTALPADAPPIVIVQHMPEKFTTSFAQQLNDLCEMDVKEAEDGDEVRRGLVLIAPGNYHTMLERNGSRYHVSVKEGPLVSRHRPSVDVLFRSAADFAGANAVGVIMTGMCDDGARGMQEMKEAGAFTIAQDEATSVVFGMPKEAIARGCVDRILPLQDIAEEILKAAANHCAHDHPHRLQPAPTAPRQTAERPTRP